MFIELITYEMCRGVMIHRDIVIVVALIALS